MTYFRAEDAEAYEAAVKSIEDRQQGELYTMTWSGDCHLSRVLETNCTNSMEAIAAACKFVLNDAPPPTIVTGVGCSAFAATNSAGAQLVGRNFDYRYPMAHVLLYSNRDPANNRDYASVGTVDAGFAGFDVGSLTNLTDQSRADYPWHAALFPLLCMDGMNDAGFMVTVLSLDARPDPKGGNTRMTEQFASGHTNIVPTLAIRYLLDHAGSTAQGVAMLTNFNMFAASDPEKSIPANYHFLLCDKSGDTRVVEWLPPAEQGGSWTPWVTNATAVSNFYLNDGYGHGSNRWEIMRHALAQQQDHLEVENAMNLCRAVSQKKGAEQTSWTHWSVVYNLTDLSAEIATLGNYGEIFPYALKGSDDWSFGAPKSAKPVVRTDLPLFPSDPKTATSDKIYLLADPIADPSDPSGEPPSFAGASVAAVNRMGLTYDAGREIIHAVATNASNAKVPAVFYIDMSSGDVSKAAYSIVAGVNYKGLVGRVVKFRDSTGTGDISPSKTLLAVLNNCGTVEAASAIMKANKQGAGGCGFVLSDAMGNVAIWGPEGAELCEDDASEMVRNSLDLRKGVYEADGEGRGEFDELPGLMRLASTSDTKTIVSMGYGHLDVMLPESNVVWRAEIKDADVPQYGVVTEPPTVDHAKLKSLTDANGVTLVRNNQGQLVATVGAKLKVTYTAEAGYYFANGSGTISLTFTAGEKQTTPPASPAPMLPIATRYCEADGTEKTTNAVQISASDDACVTWGETGTTNWYVVTGDVVLPNGAACAGAVNLILADGAKLSVTGAYKCAGIAVSGDRDSLAIYGQVDGTGALDAKGGINGAGIGGGNLGYGSNITINGGKVTSTGGDFGAGIGGGLWNNGSNITINGGKVTSTGGDYGAGIGSGYRGLGSNITINGGWVMATGIGGGAGIGGGNLGYGSNITINGGKVTSTGGICGAGIGGGFRGSGSNIAINGGIVTATGGIDNDGNYGAGIGNGYSCPSPASNIFAAEDVIVKAGTTANPTTVIAHEATTDIASALAGKRYVTTVAPIAVSYVDEAGETQMTNAIPVLASDACVTWGEAGTTNWYVVVEDVVLTNGAVCAGAVNLILADGAKLSVTGAYHCAGIAVSGDRDSLAIYGQVDGTGALDAKGGECGAGIGGGQYDNGLNITINGGRVTATGGDVGTGIGGGGAGGCSNITINGGKVMATGTRGCAGIGGAPHCTVLNITINGGIVMATGGYQAAGVGGGLEGDCANITINGGSVIATSGGDAAGIGNGSGGVASNIFAAENVIVKAGEAANPTTMIPHTDTTDLAPSLYWMQYVTMVLPPTEPMASSVTVPANATAAVYTNGVLSADGTVWSNRTAFVVYTANADYRFTDDSTVITNELDTSKSPATIAAGQVVPRAVPITVPVIYHAAGGAYSDGVEAITRPEKLVTGYLLPPEPPTRKGFALAGWFTSWKSGGAQVKAGDPIVNLDPHALYAHWASAAPTPTAGMLALSDFNDDGTPSTDVAKNAHANDQTLISLTTSLYLTNIAQRAFYNCANLTTLVLTPPRAYDDLDVKLPLTIGPMAFAGSAIESLTLPAKVVLGAGAFVNATKLKRVFFLGDEKIAYEANSFLRCGDGTLKLYMSAAFQAANPTIVADVKAQNPSITVEPLVDVSPVSGIGSLSLDTSTLATDGTVTLVVPLKTLIAGASPEDAVEVQYQAQLTDAWQTLPSTVLVAGSDEVILQITPPSGSSGFFQVVVR